MDIETYEAKTIQTAGFLIVTAASVFANEQNKSAAIYNSTMLLFISLFVEYK